MTSFGAACLPVLLAAVIVATSGAPPAASEVPYPVKNINTGGASTPTSLVTMGGVTYFAADNGADGIELWRSDGTAAGTVMVKDICGGPCSSWPFALTVVPLPGGERLFFAADNGVDGFELWKSDGTAPGTVMVKDISSSGSAEVDLLTAVGNELFFRAKNDSAGRELWKSDGTAAGTVMVKDIFAGNGSSTPTDLVAMGGTLFFSAVSNALGRELWKSDGTAAGTVAVKDINPGMASSSPARLCAVGSTVFFIAYSGTGYELWKSDGSPAGTSLVKNINPGFFSSNPEHLTDVGGLLYFVADDGSTGAELWKSDGSLAGTVQVKDIIPGGVSSEASDLTAAGNLLYFAAEDPQLGRELWRSDGTGAGTYLVEDINTGPADSSPSELQASEGSLFFVADDGLDGRELWVSDGTGAGTLMVDDLYLGPASSGPTEPTPATSLLLFAADDGQIGRELWALRTGGPVLGLTKVFQDGVVEAGTGNHTFELTVTNTGSGPANAVRVTDPVDTIFTIDDIQPAAECAASFGQLVDCTFPTLGAGEIETVTVTYSIDAGETPTDDVLNVATAGDSEGQMVEASDTVDVIAPCTLPQHIDIVDEVIYEVYLAEACLSISAGPSVSVMPGADATLVAAQVVTLNEGFFVEEGATLTVTN